MRLEWLNMSIELELNCKHQLIVSDDIDLLDENINITWGRKTGDTEVGMMVINQGCIHTEIKGKLNMANACYSSLTIFYILPHTKNVKMIMD
jgi:hypothetical protein